MFAHLSKVIAHVGQPVAQGDVIGLVGATGEVTAAHLHYEVHVNGVPTNPMPWLHGAHSLQGHPGSSAEQRLGDVGDLDLVGAGVDLQHLGVVCQLFDVEFEMKEGMPPEKTKS